jgi:hypothetical protein
MFFCRLRRHAIIVSFGNENETPKSALKGLISLIPGDRSEQKTNAWIPRFHVRFVRFWNSEFLAFLGIWRFATVGHRMGHLSHTQNRSNILVMLAGIAKVGHFGTMPFGVPNVPFR